MIRTATGIALLILIAIYGILYIKSENFTSTINFVTVIDAFQKMTGDEKALIMQTGKRVLEQLGESLLTKMTTAPITNADANQIVDTINKSISTEFAVIIKKYQLNSVDIISLVIYAFVVLVNQSQGGPEMTPIIKQNLETLSSFVKNWNPSASASSAALLPPTITSASMGKSASVPSLAFFPPVALVAASSGKSIPTSASSTASIPTSASSGSLFTGNINDFVKVAVRDELKAIASQPSLQSAYAPGTRLAYDGGATQNLQQNAACQARDWCCHCRRPRHQCHC
jgi:hypothetical protein